VPAPSAMERLGAVRRECSSACVRSQCGTERRKRSTTRPGPDGVPRLLMSWCEPPSPPQPEDRKALGSLYLDDGRLAADVATRAIAERLMGEISSRLGSAATLVETRSSLQVRIHSRSDSLPVLSLASLLRRATAGDDDGKAALRAPRAAQPLATVVDRRSASVDVTPRSPSAVVVFARRPLWKGSSGNGPNYSVCVSN